MTTCLSSRRVHFDGDKGGKVGVTRKLYEKIDEKRFVFKDVYVFKTVDYNLKQVVNK